MSKIYEMLKMHYSMKKDKMTRNLHILNLKANERSGGSL